jgi:hypothetical protein
LNQFDIFMWKPPGWPDAHPAVIVSHPDRVARKSELELVMCSTKRAGRSPEGHEIMLDEADGLDWPTLCKCDLLYTVAKSELKQKKGRVTKDRQRQLVRTIIVSHYWGAVLGGTVIA